MATQNFTSDQLKTIHARMAGGIELLEMQVDEADADQYDLLDEEIRDAYEVIGVVEAAIATQI
jgi:hypothetical protein